jgi:hypothetical protein
MFFRMRETAALPLLLIAYFIIIILLIKCIGQVKAKIIIKNSARVSNEVSVSLAVSVV